MFAYGWLCRVCKTSGFMQFDLETIDPFQASDEMYYEHLLASPHCLCKPQSFCIESKYLSEPPSGVPDLDLIPTDVETRRLVNFLKDNVPTSNC